MARAADMTTVRLPEPGARRCGPRGPCMAVAVTDWEPAELRATLPDATEIVVVSPTGTDREVDDVRYVGVQQDGDAFWRQLADAVRGHAQVAVLDGEERLPVRWLRALYYAGVRSLWVPRGREWARVTLLGRLIVRHAVVAIARVAALAAPPPSGRKPARRWLWRAFKPLLEPVLRFDVAERRWRRHADERRRAWTPSSSGLEVVLYVSSLNSGGAERQQVNLAVGLKQQGHRVRVLAARPLRGEEGHYAALLERERIPVSKAGGPSSYAGQHRLDADDLVPTLNHEIRAAVLDLAGELMARPVDVLHATLDYTNVVGAAAGILAGVPRIVLSTRNSNPSHFSFYRPWMDHWYRFLATLPNVQFIANSAAGAEDYARWTGVAPSRFTVILNGVDLAGLAQPAPADAAAVRTEIGAGPADPMVVGIFRLSWEKQPLLFVDVVARAAALVPGLKAALVGVGADHDRVRAEIDARGLTSTIAMLGQRADVASILSAADVFLLTSAYEGTPNVALEAQWFGCPPVLTAVGGSPETIEHGITGFVHARDDADGLTASVVRLLTDRELRSRMAGAGRRWVERRFAMDRVVERTLRVYRAEAT